MALSPSVSGKAGCRRRAPSIAADVVWAATRGWDVPYLIVLVIAVVVVILVMRAAAASGRGGGMPQARAPRRPRPPARPPARPLAPDDDPEFLRELERRRRRDDNPTA